MHKADADDVAMLKAYVAESFSSGDAGIDRVRPRSDVTVVMYFFWNGDAAPGKWPDFEGALLATWRCCGCLPTVVVSNANHPCVVDFAARYSNVQVQIEDSLAPGDINAMSIDCNARLYARFSTKYVLIVQDDGFPIRPGLDEFVEMGYDFIGAPYCRPSFLPNLLTKVLRFCPSNGGFSLRSQRFCRLVAEYWGKYANRPFVVKEMSEDLFCTSTLPKRHLLFWMRRRQSPSGVSARFSQELFSMSHGDVMPFGFHTATAFAELHRRFGIMPVKN